MTRNFKRKCTYTFVIASVLLLFIDIGEVVIPLGWPGTPVVATTNAQLHIVPELREMDMGKFMGAYPYGTNIVYTPKSKSIPETSSGASLTLHPFLEHSTPSISSPEGLVSPALPKSLAQVSYQVLYNTQQLGLTFTYDVNSQTLQLVLPSRIFRIGDQTINVPEYVIKSVSNIPEDSIIKFTQGTFLVSDLVGRELYFKDKNISFSVYKPEIDNLLRKYDVSFEDGLWQAGAKDCSIGMGGSADMYMQLSNDTTNGSKSLELGASNHYACNFATFPVNIQKNDLYMFSFDGKSLSGDTLQYYYGFYQQIGANNVQLASHTGTFIDHSQSWHNYKYIIDPTTANSQNGPQDWFDQTSLNVGNNSFLKSISLDHANTIQLYLYAPSSGTKKVVDRYDNLSLSSYVHDSDIVLDNSSIKESLVRYDNLRLSQVPFTVFLSDDKQNLLDPNIASFETGLWQQDVSDCSTNLGGDPSMSMSLSSDSSSGKHSVQLTSNSHFACTWTRFPIALSDNYLYNLSFDYKTVSGNLGQIYYRLNGQNDTQTGSKQVVAKPGSGWHTADLTIDPSGQMISSIDIYLYAPSDGSNTIQTRYDNIRLQKSAPRDLSNFIIKSDPDSISGTATNFDIKQTSNNYWLRSVSVTGVRGPFLVVLPEQYNLKWEIANKGVWGRGILGLLASYTLNSSTSLAEQRKYSTSNANAWWINPEIDCGTSVSCHTLPNGLKQISFTIVYSSDFTLLLMIISGLVWGGCLYWMLNYRRKGA